MINFINKRIRCLRLSYYINKKVTVQITFIVIIIKLGTVLLLHLILKGLWVYSTFELNVCIVCRQKPVYFLLQILFLQNFSTEKRIFAQCMYLIRGNYERPFKVENMEEQIIASLITQIIHSTDIKWITATLCNMIVFYLSN